MEPLTNTKQEEVTLITHAENIFKVTTCENIEIQLPCVLPIILRLSTNPSLVTEPATGGPKIDIELIKKGKYRNVFRMIGTDKNFILKYYHPTGKKKTGVKDSLKKLFLGSHAAREYNSHKAVAQAGICVPQLLMHGEVIDGSQSGCSFLLMREVQNALSLGEIFKVENHTRLNIEPVDENGTSQKRLSAISHAGSLLAMLHNAHFFHRDLHSENILISTVPKSGSQSSVTLIDLHGAVRFEALELEQLVHNMCQLLYSLRLCLNHRERWHLWARYWQKLTPAIKDIYSSSLWGEDRSPLFVAGDTKEQRLREKVWHHVQTKYIEHENASLARGDRKWFRGNRRISISQTSHATTRMLTAYKPVLDKIVSSNAAENTNWEKDLMQADACEVIKTSKNRSVGSAVIQAEDYQIHVICKVKSQAAIRAGMLSGIGKLSPARQAWEYGHMLLRRGIPTALPLAIHESYSYPLPYLGRSLLGTYQGSILYEKCPHAVALSAYFDVYFHEMSTHQRQSWLTRYIPLAAEAFQKLHQANFDHRDLKSNNILVHENRDETAFWLIDLDALRRWPLPMPQQRIAQNLARFAVDAIGSGNVSMATCLRFLKTYLGEYAPNRYALSGLKRETKSWKAMWKSIQKIVDKRLIARPPQIHRVKAENSNTAEKRAA